MFDTTIENDLADYIAAKNKFSEVNDYYGMLASQKSLVFVKYYTALSAEKQKDMSYLLVIAACGEHSKFAPSLPVAVNLILCLCFSGFSQNFQDSISVLEKEFNSNENVKIWLEADDSLEIIGGLSWRQTWRYALSLYNILKLLDSKKIQQTLNILRTKAISDEFKKCLS